MFSLNELTSQLVDNNDINYENLKLHMIHVQKCVDDFSHRLPFVTICLLDCYRVYYFRNPNLQRIAAKNPFTNVPTLSKSKSVMNVGFVVGFACATGTEADNNQSQKNALFTKHLLNHIAEPSKDIIKVLHTVTEAVIAESKSKQIPHYTVSLSTEDNICFCEKASNNSSRAEYDLKKKVKGNVAKRCFIDDLMTSEYAKGNGRGTKAFHII